MNELRKKNGKSETLLRKITLYKDTAINAMNNEKEFGTAVIQSNDGYLEKLLKADETEYAILKDNMARAESETERQAIRDRMAEMKKERYAKDTENKSFYERQEDKHKTYTLQVLGSVAVVAGLTVKFRKPLVEAGKKLISKNYKNISTYSERFQGG